jgi:N-acetylmuramoyl-L-alanine amidase
VLGVALAAVALLAGETVVIDPGHNGANGAHPAEINRQVAIGGGETKACDTTGTATAGGYSESSYNLAVARSVARILRAEGATVILTRRNNRGVGPCIDERARIGNRAGADAAVSIHADGGPPGGRGFHVI